MSKDKIQSSLNFIFAKHVIELTRSLWSTYEETRDVALLFHIVKLLFKGDFVYVNMNN